MSKVHVGLAGGKWQKLTLMEQMANVGSEVSRAIRWKNKGREDISRRALFRALELIDLTLAGEVRLSGLREIARVRELLLDTFMGENQYGITDEDWQKYFLDFAKAR